MTRKSLCGLDPEEILQLTGPDNYTREHSLSVAYNVYRKHEDNISRFIKIPAGLKEKLAGVSVAGIFKPSGSQISSDGTIKYLFENDRGLRHETVFIPDGRRNTVCVSSQSGCRMGCSFCLTGKYGFHGNLTAGEIVNQIISLPAAREVTHVVFMGMGEPMDNLEEVLKACRIITAEWGLALSHRNVTVSTVGITPAVERFLEESDCNLALSLHSPFEEERLEYIPAERKYPAGEIISMMKDFPLRKKRRLSVAYVMIEGNNDTDAHLEALKSLFGGSRIRINLLPYHVAGDDSLRSSSPGRIMHFKHELVISGISASIRRSRGEDISAACGLLASGLKNLI